MADLIQFFDDVDIAKIPANATHIAYYADGRYANGTAAKKRFPHAEMISITVHADGVADACDCELGDLTVDQCVAWIDRRVKAGAYRPRAYASWDTWEHQGLRSRLAHYGDKIQRWEASYPGSGANVPPGYNAHQYATGSVDTNVGLVTFFDKEAPHPAHSTGTAVATVKVDLKTGVAHVHHMPGSAHFAGPKQKLDFDLSLMSGGGGGKWAIKKG